MAPGQMGDPWSMDRRSSGEAPHLNPNSVLSTYLSWRTGLPQREFRAHPAYESSVEGRTIRAEGQHRGNRRDVQTFPLLDRGSDLALAISGGAAAARTILRSGAFGDERLTLPTNTIGSHNSGTGPRPDGAP